MFQFTHPGKGATPADGIPRVSGTCFNSRTLGRVRRLSASALADFCPFQFTHPGKGATELVCCISSLLRVSIHAPWEGCDTFYPSYKSFGNKFQFTHPGKGATSEFSLYGCFSPRFQFTHPGKGATIHVRSSPMVRSVSIHAPWYGCDALRQKDDEIERLFQFTHPGKGATMPS